MCDFGQNQSIIELLHCQLRGSTKEEEVQGVWPTIIKEKIIK